MKNLYMHILNRLLKCHASYQTR